MQEEAFSFISCDNISLICKWHCFLADFVVVMQWRGLCLCYLKQITAFIF